MNDTNKVKTSLFPEEKLTGHCSGYFLVSELYEINGSEHSESFLVDGFMVACVIYHAAILGGRMALSSKCFRQMICSMDPLGKRSHISSFMSSDTRTGGISLFAKWFTDNKFILNGNRCRQIGVALYSLEQNGVGRLILSTDGVDNTA